MTKDAIVFKNVCKEFSPGDFGVRDLDFQIKEGEMVAIVGKTGCGKSTAFNLLLGLTKPTSGQVKVDGLDPYQSFQEFKGKLGMVFQNDRLLPWRTALENAAIGLEVNGLKEKERNKIAMEWLERLGLSGWEDKFPHELSGGMKQRVSIARAFSVDPKIILCDESFSALDELTAIKLRKEFVHLIRENNKTGVFITHSIGEAIEMADRVLVYKKPGHVAKEITVPSEIDVKKMEELRKNILNGMDIA
ncbi:ABC transporter ATP-binding protein [Alteribacillus sp. YIM 98480]|uniref:ABC transporter ATP-binding protein n=1 Tax=Alteribacillus sp. YIM 98480 TaxID=2606599 RepID=UPI00131C205C|nr:ABC transporter ATP-binding protein [Alteribacillus sp. YIM 98480]